MNISEKQDAIRRNWFLEEVGEVPFLVEVGPFHAGTGEFLHSDQAELEWNLNYHRQREMVDDYGMPNLKPNMGIGIVAEAFGCPSTPNDVADPWVTPLIRGSDAVDIGSITVPDAKTCPAFKRAYDRLAYFEAISDLPLRLVNVPSPLVTATLIWEYSSCMEATLINPSAVHALLEKVTHVTIEYLREQRRRIRNLHTMGHEMWYIPPEVGVRISDDAAVLLSPDLYREFGVRYNSIISRAMGGIVVHSCGDVQNVVGAMMETEALRGLDLTIPQNPRWDIIRDAVDHRSAINLRHFYWDHPADAHVDLAAYSRELVAFFGRRGTFIQTGAPTPLEAAALAHELHRELGPSRF